MAYTREDAAKDIAGIEALLRQGFAPMGANAGNRERYALGEQADRSGQCQQALRRRLQSAKRKWGVEVDWGVYRPRPEKRDAIEGKLGTKPVLPGFGIKATSAQLGASGEVEREWVKQAPLGEPFEVPEGHTVKGVSALVDPHGNELVKWIKTKEADNGSLLVEAIKSAFDAYTGRGEFIEAPESANDDLVTVYNIADHHLGLYAWAAEVGQDYDLDIGERVLIDCMKSLVSGAPSASTGIILNLGDFFHSDNNSNRTERSGNALDVDTRYAKVLQIGIKLLVACVEMALTKHKRVIVRCLPGNHDPHTSLALSAALAAFFHANPRVEVDCDPSKFFWFVFGDVFIAATHGDQVKPERMPGVMASFKSEDWGATKHRYAYFGHVHHKSRGGGEQDGVVWECFQATTAKDAWHYGMGYSSGRSMVAITHHKRRGEIMRHTHAVTT